MSVRKGDRAEGKLQVLNKARELKAYTLQRAKVLPKSTRWLYAYPIAEEVRTACLCIRRANSVYFTENSAEDYQYRHAEQIKAYSALGALLDLIDDVFTAGYISGEQAETWAGLILSTQDKLKAWIKSDTEKYKRLKG